MAAPMQTPTATADAPAMRPCMWCYGSGRIPNDDHQRYDACSACGGSGANPAPRPAERIAA